MKKIIALVLVLAMALSLCACGEKERYPEIADLLDAGDYEGAVAIIYKMYQEHNSTDENGNPVTEPPKPTDEEKDTLRKFINIWRTLNDYIANDSSYISYYDEETETSYNGSAALGCYYEMLKNFDYSVIDKWMDTEYTTAEYWGYENLSFDYKALMANFTIINDVLLNRKVWYEDSLGNINDYDTRTYTYNVDGVCTYRDSGSHAFDANSVNYYYDYGVPEYTYDESGKLTTVRYLEKNSDKVNCIIKYTYNADGTVATEEYVDRDGTEVAIAYTYKDGRLVSATGMPDRTGYNSGSMKVEYTYDSNGKLVKEYGTPEKADSNWRNDYMVEYKYDDAGKLASVCVARLCYDKNWDTQKMELKRYENVNYYTYTYEGDRLIKSDHGYYGSYNTKGEQTYDPESDVYVSDYIYGDYYIYAISE